MNRHILFSFNEYHHIPDHTDKYRKFSILHNFPENTKREEGLKKAPNEGGAYGFMYFNMWKTERRIQFVILLFQIYVTELIELFDFRSTSLSPCKVLLMLCIYMIHKYFQANKIHKIV